MNLRIIVGYLVKLALYEDNHHFLHLQILFDFKVAICQIHEKDLIIMIAIFIDCELQLHEVFL